MPPRTRVRAPPRKFGPVQPSTRTETVDSELEQYRLLAAQVIRGKLAKAADGWRFADFCSSVINLDLTEAQAAIADVLFDFEPPSALSSGPMFGGLTSPPPQEARQTAMALCGRGSGKTRVFIAARALHLALTVRLDKLAPGEPGLVVVVAPDQRQSRHSLGFVKSILSENRLLGEMLKVEDTLDVVRLVRPDGHPVQIEARPATGGGKAVRGLSLMGVLMEEAAFFYGEGYEVSDEEIYRAARPRLLPGGQIVLATTPWAQAGLAWDLYRESFGHPKRAIVAKAPTIVMRPDPATEAMVALERDADPDNAAREFDAEFLSGDAERFFPEPLLERCIDHSLALPLDVATGQRVRFGADFAFDADHSALVGLMEQEPPKDSPRGTPTTWVACAIEEERPLPGRHLVPSEVVENFARVVRTAGGKLVVADAHYRRSIEEELSKYELALVPPPPVPAESFMVMRALMAAGRVKVPNHHRLLAQLRRVRSSHKPGGVVTIHQPRARDGGHGDIVSAMVCALSGVSIAASRPIESPKTRLEAEARAEAEARTERFKEQADRTKKADGRFALHLRRTLGKVAGRTLERLRHV